MSNSERNLETLPTGSLGIIPLQSCQELGEKVDKYLVKWRDERQHQHQNDAAFMGYKRDSYIIEAVTPRFGSGEAKGMIKKLFVVMTFILWLMLLTTALLILYVVRQTICPQMIITRI